MAIQIDCVTADAQGLPVVSWIEDRNMFAPGRRVRISCYVRPDERTGELLFVREGVVRHGAKVEIRPWQKLEGFELRAADDLYDTAQDKAMKQTLGNKFASARILLADGAYVVLAGFGRYGSPALPMHVNCADATPAEAQELHTLLKRLFIDERDSLLRTVNFDGLYVWPENGKAYQPYQHKELPPAPWWHEWVANWIVVAVLGLAGLGFWWLVS